MLQIKPTEKIFNSVHVFKQQLSSNWVTVERDEWDTSASDSASDINSFWVLQCFNPYGNGL